jgi:hypothetical protein
MRPLDVPPCLFPRHCRAAPTYALLTPPLSPSTRHDQEHRSGTCFRAQRPPARRGAARVLCCRKRIQGQPAGSKISMAGTVIWAAKDTKVDVLNNTSVAKPVLQSR